MLQLCNVVIQRIKPDHMPSFPPPMGYLNHKLILLKIHLKLYFVKLEIFLNELCLFGKID